MTKMHESTNGLAKEMETLQSLSNVGLRKRWAETFRKSPPKYISHDLLLRGIAYRIQERVSGGLKPATKRRLVKLAVQVQEGSPPRLPTTQPIKPGARLLREWQGTTHSVTVVESGFEYQGRIYRNLSSIARDITGTRWSGPRFFCFREAQHAE